MNSLSLSRRRFVKTFALGTVFVERTTPTGFYTVAIKIIGLTDG